MAYRITQIILKRKKFVIFLVAGLVAVGGVLYGINILNTPAEGKVSVATVTPKRKQTPRKDLVSQFITFKYPGRYTQETNANKSASLESSFLTAHQVINEGPSTKVAVTIAKLPDGGATEDSAYKQFVAFPNYYTITNEKFHEEPVIIASRTDPNFEQTALWAHGQYLATISMIAGQRTDQLSSELRAILGGLTWQ